MKTRNIIAILAALPLVAGFTGCKSDEETEAKPAKEILIVEGGNEIVLRSGDSIMSVPIKADCAWTVESFESADGGFDGMLSVQPQRGNGNGALVITTNQNRGVQPRLATITLTSDGGLKQIISLRQTSGDPTMSISERSVDFAASPDAAKQLVIESNKGWTIDMPSGVSWVHLNKVSGNAGSETVDITVVKPDLWLSDVSWAPADTIDWGNIASFLVRVSNRSVATLYQPYALKLWANKLDSDGNPTKWNVVSSGNYNGIQGNSTSVQILNWNPASSGSWRLLLTLEKGNGADFDTTYYLPLDWETVDTAFGEYAYSYEFTVKDGLNLHFNPNKSGEDADFGANIFVGSEYAITVNGEMSLSSKPDRLLNSVADGAMISARLEYNSDSSVSREAVLTDNGTGKFTGSILTEGLESGMYTLTYFAQGAGYTAEYNTQIMFIDDIIGTVTTPYDTYVAGDMITISGNAGVGNTPYTGTIALDLDLHPYYGYRLPNGAVISGEVPDGYELFWRGEKTVFLTADENGNFTYSFKSVNTWS